MKWNSCPTCKGLISWRQRWKLSTAVGFRKPLPCPHCGSVLVWSKWPHRLIYSGIFFFGIFALLQLLRLLQVELWIASQIIAWIGILLAAFGLFTLKLDMADSDKSKCSKDERPG
jgi:hypothetical protein